MVVVLDIVGWGLCWIMWDVGYVGYCGMWVVLDIAGCGFVGYCGMWVILDNVGCGLCWIMWDVGCVG